MPINPTLPPDGTSPWGEQMRSAFGEVVDAVNANEAAIEAVGDVTAAAEAARDDAQQAASTAASYVENLEGTTGPLLVAYHRTNDYASFIGVSDDGVHFEPTGIRWLPTGSNKATNPSLEIVEDKIWMTFGTTSEQIGLASSENGRDFTTHTFLDGALSGPLWAPDFYREDGVTYVIFTNRSASGGAMSFRTYERHTTGTDLATAVWTPPVQLSGIPDGGIDLHVRKVDDTYHGFYTQYGGPGVEGGTNGGGDGKLYHATATSITGPWTVLGPLDPSWHHTEGAVTVPLVNKDGWRMYVDSGGYSQNIVGATDSQESVGGIFYTDFDRDFSAHGPLRPVPLAMRHIGVIPLPQGNDKQYDYLRTPAGATVARMYQSENESITLVDRGSAVDVASTEVFQFSSGEKFGDINWTTDARTVPSVFDRITIRENGLYMLSASVYITGGIDSDWFTLTFGLNGSKIGSWVRGGRNGGGMQGTFPPVPMWLKRGDYVQLVINGEPKTLTKRRQFCWATVQRVG